MERTRVLVIGAGPVGVTAAYRLALHGIDVILIEAEASCREDMRASTLHPPTLEMLSALGVLDALEAQGLRAPVYHYRNRRTNEVLAFDLGDISDLTPYPYRLQCEQFKISRLLTRLVDEHPLGSVRFSRRALAFDQDDEGVTVHVEAAFKIETYRADYVIGADGANSVVRKWLDIPFEGFTYPEKFLTLSTQWPIEESLQGLAGVNYVADPEEWCVLLRVPQYWRVLVPTLQTETDETLLSDDKKTAVFSRLVGSENAVRLRTDHRTIYRVHQRVAKTYRAGRILLAGDAAHLNNPLGGFGMNSGVHDVWNLTEKLIAIGQGAGADTLLDLYDRQRRTVMHEFVQAQTMRNKKALEAGSAEAQLAHQAEMAAILADDDRRRDYLMVQSMISSINRAASII